MKHTVCHIEFGSADLDRSTAFYCALFNWTVARSASNELIFRSPDGLQGTIRRVDTVTPSRLPLIRIEVDDYAPVVEMAARFHGGYSGFVDPVQGDWAVNLRDPDGNLIRLARMPMVADKGETESPPAFQPEPGAARSVAESRSVSLDGRAVVPDTRRINIRANGHAPSNGNGSRANGSRDKKDNSLDS